MRKLVFEIDAPSLPGLFRPPVYKLTVMVAVIGLIAFMVTGGLPTSGEPESGKPDAAPGGDDVCIACHSGSTPGIIAQFASSKKARAGVTCKDCHEVTGDYPGGKEHMGTHIVSSPTPAICGKCHPSEVTQYYQSRHSAPAYTAMRGVEGLTASQLEMYRNIPEGSFAPDKERNALYGLEGEGVTRFACHGCHDIGKPQADGSIGQCQKCHLRHEFSLEQVRKPETCNACHIGPDHPQWEIYEESPHGIAYMSLGHKWNWEAEPGTLTATDFPAPTCAICHMSGFGGSGSTHDVGERLTWYLFASKSERRPAWEENRTRMQDVCRSCHNENFVNGFYADADKATEAVNAWVDESNSIMAPLKESKLLTAAQFDEPIDFAYFELWHHWGRTAKFGCWMQGADYVQWHGAYEILKGLKELREMAAQKQKVQ